MLPGKAVTLTANPVSAPRYQWIRDGAPITNATAANYIVNQPGVYTVISYNNAGCSSDLSPPIQILVDPASKSADVTVALETANREVVPSEVFDYVLRITNHGPDLASAILTSVIFAYQVQFVSFSGPLSGFARYDQDKHSLIWQVSKLGIGETADLKIRVKAPEWGSVKNSATISAAESDPKLANNTALHIQSIMAVKVPNVFTPNNDGKNDRFVISGLENYAANEITIINRWGSSVYEKKNYANDWTANGLSDGTYFYVLRVRTTNSEWQDIKGYLTVIR